MKIEKRVFRRYLTRDFFFNWKLVKRLKFGFFRYNIVWLLFVVQKRIVFFLISSFTIKTEHVRKILRIDKRFLDFVLYNMIPNNIFNDQFYQKHDFFMLEK